MQSHDEREKNKERDNPELFRMSRDLTGINIVLKIPSQLLAALETLMKTEWPTPQGHYREFFLSILVGYVAEKNPALLDVKKPAKPAKPEAKPRV